MKKRTGVWVTLLLVPCLLVAAWAVTYPGDDPKNLHYLLWKWGVVPMNTDRALGIMIGDPARGRLVIGKSEEQLKARFGYVRMANEASPYLRYCLLNSPWSDKTVLFLRNSNWMVVFRDGKVTTLVLAKGC